MKQYEPKYRWHLTSQQLRLLSYIHKFRFVTTDVLAEILKKDRSTIYERLAVLEQQGYVLKQYDDSYRIRRRQATYCLASAGVRALTGKVEAISLKQNYKNKSFTEAQIDECLQLCGLYLYFRRFYAEDYGCFTKYQLDREDFVRPTPLLHVKTEREDLADFIVEVIPAGTPTWLILKRIRQHEEFADEYEYTYPHILFVAGNDNTERRIVEHTGELYDDFKVYTTTLPRILHAVDATIWQDPETSLDEDERDNPTRIPLPTQFSEDQEE